MGASYVSKMLVEASLVEQLPMLRVPDFQGNFRLPAGDGGFGMLIMGTLLELGSTISCGSSVKLCPLSMLGCVPDGWESDCEFEPVSRRLEDAFGNLSKSSPARRSMGDQPAAILPATMPLMTVAAPSALFDLERMLLLRLRESGVGTAE